MGNSAQSGPAFVFKASLLGDVLCLEAGLQCFCPSCCPFCSDCSYSRHSAGAPHRLLSRA